MKTLCTLALAFILVTSAFGQSNEVSLAGTQTRKIHSTLIPGQEYVLQISLPASYNSGTKRYPVVFVLDGQWDFPLVSALYGQQYYDGFIPEMIIVGLTWGGDHPNADSLRARDYTPTKVSRLPQSGGAESFLSVLSKEVIPFISDNYRINPEDKTLMGCSLGGLFTLYTLFTHPDIFNRYIAASPAFTWDDNVLYRYEQKYFEHASHNPPADVFICVGGVETSAPGFGELTSLLNSRQYPQLKLESRVLANTGHSGTKGEGYARGLQFVFKRPDIKLPAEVLKRYEGTYQLKDGTSVDFRSSNGTLTGTADQMKFPLHAASATDFYLTSSFMKIHFAPDEKGGVSGFQLDVYGHSEFVPKIKTLK